jgi:two-component system phosphate regulon sensor histidine kinase PhoR
MKQDYWRLVIVLFASLGAGIVFDQKLLCLLTGAIAYLLWVLFSVDKLRRWIKNLQTESDPTFSGVVEDIAREVDFIRFHHKQREEKLANYLRRFQLATQALPDALIVLGTKSEIEWANKKAEEYLGIKFTQDSGNRIVNLVRHPDLIAFVNKGASDAEIRSLELESPINPDMRLEFRLARYGDAQSILVARDITPIYRINKMRTDFIANASHELRTPLTVISGYLESLEDELSDEQKQNRWGQQIKQMRRQTQRMRRLIDDLLRLASLESADELENVEVVQVPSMINTIQEEAKAISEIKHLISIDVDQGLWIKGDRNQLYSAFSNLIFNAVQHTHKKGVITIRWYEDSSGPVFEVSDTGEGIESDHIPRLTERFYRVDKGRSRSRGGTGLGLAIVKHVLARHRAKLNIQSVLGKGSTFQCRFGQELIVHRQESTGDTLTA